MPSLADLNATAGDFPGRSRSSIGHLPHRQNQQAALARALIARMTLVLASA